jgi:hypothetical protein
MNIQEQAERYIKELDLIQILSKYGEAHLVGSVALKTTVKPDIDFSIYLNEEMWETAIDYIKQEFSKIGLSDFHERRLKESGKYLLSYDFLDENKTAWSIDVTLTQPGGDYLTDSYKFVQDFKDKFTPEKIKTIKNIKKYFYKKEMSRNSMSYYIYRAVLDENIKNVKEMYDYLKRNKINIGRFKR